jgi:CheY-like chemotaxis protein
MDNDDELLFADEPADAASPVGASKPWQILLVDDDPEVHASTRLALANFVVDGAGMEFSNAYSGTEAFECLQRLELQLPDLVLMDVVMDTATDGIDTAHRIRSELAMLHIPVIYIRTGQPGSILRLNDLAINKDIDKVLYKGDASLESLRENVKEGLLLSRKARQSADLQR